MIAEPEAAEGILYNHHAQAYHHGIGDSQIAIACQTVTAEDEATDNGLQQAVGEAHTAKDAKVMQHSAYTLESVPCRNDSGNYHQQYNEVVYWPEPSFQRSEINETEDDDNRCRYEKNRMPYLQVLVLDIEKALAP